MVPKRKRIARDALIFGSIAVAMLFAAELGLRILYPEKLLKIAEERHRIENIAYRFEPEYLVALKPNRSKTYTRQAANGGDVVRWTTNSASFRGRELRSQPDVRIIVYGDSNIQARFSHLDQTFPYKLEEYLSSLSQRDIEVINGGIVGSGPDQVLIRFSSEIDVYKPDVVIFHVNADNDLGDIVRNRLFELDAGGGLVRTHFQPTVDQRLTESQIPGLLITRAAQKLVRSITESNLTIEGFLALADQEFAVYRERQPRSFSHFADHYDFDIALHSDGESATMKTTLLNRILESAKSISEENDVELLVLIQPSSRDLTQNLSINYQQLQRYPSYRSEGLTSIVDRICSRHGIRRVNLYPVFSRNNPESLFFKANDDHWNDAGQELAARETADYLYSNILASHRDDQLEERRAQPRTLPP